MRSFEEQMAHGEKLVAVARKWAESKGFSSEKTHYAKVLAASVSAVQDAGPSMLTFDEMNELLAELAKVQ